MVQVYRGNQPYSLHLEPVRAGRAKDRVRRKARRKAGKAARRRNRGR